MNEQERIRKALAGLHASEDTMREVLNMAERQTGNRRPGRQIAAIVLAACLVLALAVTAAASGGVFHAEGAMSAGEFFHGIFGRGIEGRESFDVKWENENTGAVKTEHYPAVERVEVDAELAQSLVGPFVTEVNTGVTVGGYTVIVRNVVLDENGIGMLAYEVENPNGINRNGIGSIKDVGKEYLAVRMSTASGEAVDSMELALTEGFGETGATFICYFTPFTVYDGQPLRLEFRAMEAGDELQHGEVELSVENVVKSKSFAADDVLVRLSPLGMTVSRELHGAQIVIRFQDGGEYVLSGEDVCNTPVSSLLEDGTAAYAFNRLVDVDQVAEIVITENPTD